MEAIRLDQLDSQLIANGLIETQRRQQAISNTTGESEKAEIAIHLETYQALSSALSKLAVPSVN